MTNVPAPTFALTDLIGVLLGVVSNVTVLLGVVAWGWAPGNVWIAFLAESIAVGVTTAMRLHRLGPGGSLMDHRFWLVWYGTFTLVQGVFVAITAFLTGVRLDPTLAIPLILVIMRFGAEVLEIGSAPAQRRPWLLVGPITRMLVLHLSVILGFGLALGAAAEGALDQPYITTPGLTLTGATAPLAVLMAVKTVAELGVGVAWFIAARRARR